MATVCQSEADAGNPEASALAVASGEEDRPFRLFSSSLMPCESSTAERAELWCSGSDTAFLLKNFLSAAECDEIIAQAERFGFEDCGYSPDIRVTDRVSVMDQELANLFFRRAMPYLADVFVPNMRSKDAVATPQSELEGVAWDMSPGLWRPAGLNPMFRACRYDPGGFFQPHFDGGFDTSKFVRSIKTFMIYLNDDFEGGPTSFYNEDQGHYSPGRYDNVIYELRPEKGSCLVFNHQITHDGGEVLSGRKYILRTEVMYQHAETRQ